MFRCIIGVCLLLLPSLCFSQVVVVVDNDTFEVLDGVGYALYNNRQLVGKGVVLSDKATTLPNSVVFDSVSFSQVDYKTLGLAKKDLDTLVFLTKDVIHLDEVVISSQNNKEIVLGETNRFVKRRSRPLIKELKYGILYRNNLVNKLQLKRLTFYVDKVQFKTAYKIHFLDVHESLTIKGYQFAMPNNSFYSTDVLYLNPKDKKAEVELPPLLYLFPDKPLFVWVELVEYYDKDGNVIDPDLDDATRLKFQISEQLNYYSKRYDVLTKQYFEELINENRIINYDFAHQFFTKPHKSDLVAPAILLYGSRVYE
ncbi:hypothetical protein GR160_10115 [Flavobacterium sp. Sd200]|uniref:hypothetical protein n=1 Tax=Flavobacterium sp. Sd200 TaxID=2692211 RepID=UPI00136A23DF|nr:hypothetical protein [Flavobacterium sp. Sd200]MXN91582.1 hypothetical protein [Flavobacterium sp. Sd200]